MAIRVSEPVFLSKSSAAMAEALLFLRPAGNIGCLSFAKGSPESLRAIPKKRQERPVREKPLPRSAKILHKTLGNMFPCLDVSNPSLRRKLPAFDRLETNKPAGRGARPRFRQTYSADNENASVKRLVHVQAAR